MRIIAGEFRSRRLFTPVDDSVTRPIPDRVKESLFAVLRGHFEGATVFDGFAGTGAIGLEAISRGAVRCVMVEQDRGIAELLTKNIEALGVKDRAELVVGDALGPGALARAPRPLTLAFLDPPYPLIQDAVGFKRIMTQMQRLVDVLSPDGFAVLRTPWPLRHSTGGGAPPAPVELKRGKDKGKPFKKGRRHDDYKAGAHGAPDDIEAVDDIEEVAAAAAPAPAAPKAVWVDADLTLPNAVGPETHSYTSMAVHLYMKKK